jgi:16S rRNA processing protein RimM
MAKATKTSYPKEKIRILFLENISDVAVKNFRHHGYIQVDKISKALTEEQLVEEIKDVHILGIRSKTQITKNILDAAKKLQAIGCFCIGVNQVDLRSATQNGVVVFNAPYSNTRSVAELVIGASIMLIRRIPDKNKAAHEGIWMKDAKGSYELRGKTLGIIGYGNIGSQVSVLAEGLGMKVIFYDVETKLPLGNAEDAKSLKELLSRADVVTLHVPETSHTKNLINKNNLKQFKKGAIFRTNKKLELKVVEYNSSRELIKFENFNDIDTAKKLTNQELFSSIEQTKENCKLKKNEFFWFDLISCNIYENGVLLGKVKDIQRYPLNDYLEIITDEELVKKALPKVFLIPHIFDKYILNVDIDNKKIEVKDSLIILENS